MLRNYTINLLATLNAANNSLLKYPISKIWLALYAVLLSFSWLMPGHYRPWSAFQGDAWIAVALVIAFFFMLINVRTVVAWSFITSACIFISLFPLAQYYLGILPYAGQAWISSLYIFGFGLTLFMGGRLEGRYPDLVANVLFAAILIASGASIYLEFSTYLGLYGNDVSDMWSMGLATRSRPFANFGQPNLFATFLTWGCLACFWLYVTKQIRASIAILTVCLLLLGISLTQSRVVKIELGLIVLGTWWWRELWPVKKIPLVVSVLYVFFLLSPLVLIPAIDALLYEHETLLSRTFLDSNGRFAIWKIFSSAIFEHPWFGYGWTGVFRAHMDMATHFPSVGAHFGHSHNLFLDLILWVGIPIGVAISVAILWVLFLHFRAVKASKCAILLLFVCVVGIHAMLELPLHHANFLLPTGLVLGVLGHVFRSRILIKTTQIWPVICFILVTMLTASVLHDYFEIESEYRNARIEIARSQINPNAAPPNIFVLTQLKDIVVAMRISIHEKMTTHELEWLLAVVALEPNTANLYKAAKAMALNGKVDQAKVWLERLCKTSRPEICALAKRAWKEESLDPKAISND